MEDLYRLLRAGHVQAQGIVDTVDDPLLVLDASLCVLAANRAFLATFKVDRFDTIGRPLYELGNRQWDIAGLRRLLEDVIPRATAIVDYEVEHDFPDLGRKTMLVTARKLYHPEHATHSLLLSVVDITDVRDRDRKKDLLFGELRHRMKNLLGLVQSIARQTAHEGRTAIEYRDDFLGRLGALIATQGLVFDDDEVATVQTLCARILEPYTDAGGAIAIDPGPVIALDHDQTQSLALVLHELATNASKYGALSVPEGRVGITLEIEDDNILKLRWRETGGPPVSPPATTGFGTRLIHSIADHNLGWNAEVTYADSGVMADITVPLMPDSLLR